MVIFLSDEDQVRRVGQLSVMKETGSDTRSAEECFLQLLQLRIRKHHHTVLLEQKTVMAFPGGRVAQGASPGIAYRTAHPDHQERYALSETIAVVALLTTPPERVWVLTMNRLELREDVLRYRGEPTLATLHYRSVLVGMVDIHNAVDALQKPVL